MYPSRAEDAAQDNNITMPKTLRQTTAAHLALYRMLVVLVYCHRVCASRAEVSFDAQYARAFEFLLGAWAGGGAINSSCYDSIVMIIVTKQLRTKLRKLFSLTGTTAESTLQKTSEVVFLRGHD